MHLPLFMVVFHQNKLKFMILIEKILLKKKILNFTIGKENKLAAKNPFNYHFLIISHKFNSKWRRLNNHNIWYLPNIMKISQPNKIINTINNRWVIRLVFLIPTSNQSVIFKAWLDNTNPTKICHNKWCSQWMV